MNISFNEKTDPAEFKEVRTIGKGGFGCVYELEHIPTGLKLAGKQINEESLTEVNKQALNRENNIMKQINSPYAVKYYGQIIFKGKITVLMDFCDRGSLRDIMDYRDKTLTEPQIAFVMHDLLTALNLLHKKLRIVHRDIKAANILATSTGEMKLTDFGVSRQFAEDAVTLSTITTIGTPYWMAPEVITIGKKYTFPADIWSVGATAVELAEGGPPYCEYEPNRAMIEIQQYGFPGFRQGSTHSAAFQNFVTRCMNVAPRLRPSIDQLLKDPFIKQIDQLDRMQVLEDLIKEEIDFSQLVDDEYEEEEEEEEEANDDDDDGIKTFNFSNQTMFASGVKDSEDDKQQQSEVEKEEKIEQKPESTPESQKELEKSPSIEKPAPEAPTVQIEEKPQPPSENTEQKENKAAKVQIPLKKTKTRKYNTKTKGPSDSKAKTKTLKGYQTFIRPSNDPVNDLYAKRVSFGTSKDEPLPPKASEPLPKQTSETVVIRQEVPAAQGKGAINKITLYGCIVLGLAVIYLSLGTKKFVLILILLLPIIFLTRNLF